MAEGSQLKYWKAFSSGIEVKAASLAALKGQNLRMLTQLAHLEQKPRMSVLKKAPF